MIIVLIINFFSNNTVSLFETFITIYTMNTKSGTNGILPHRITLDLQKHMYDLKNQQKEHLLRFDMVSNTHTF